MPVTIEESIRYREFVSRIARENGCLDFGLDQIVWHYTDGPGLLGILQSSKLYATQVSALNDAKETRHASDLFVKAVEEMLAERTFEPAETQFLRSILDLAGASQNSQVISKFFVTCFSGEEDDLAQWDRYGKQNGYAIGFFARGLQREPNSTLFRVIYDKKQHEKAARELADATLAFYSDGLKGDRLIDPELWGREFLVALG